MKNIFIISLLLMGVAVCAQNVKVLDSIINKQKLNFDIVNNKPIGDGWNF